MVRSTESYVKYIRSSTPSERKVVYKLREKEVKDKVKRDYQRPERIKKYLDKTINAIAAKKVISRRVFKKDKQATVVYKGSGNKHFKEEYEQQGAFLSWR